MESSKKRKQELTRQRVNRYRKVRRRIDAEESVDTAGK